MKRHLPPERDRACTMDLGRRFFCFRILLVVFVVVLFDGWVCCFCEAIDGPRDGQSVLRDTNQQQDMYRRLDMYNNQTIAARATRNDGILPGRTVALSRFGVSNFTVLGPTSFPKPSWMAGDGAIPHLRPTFGSHRPEQDAVLVFAAEYGLNTFLAFVYSLRDTGYTGDIVFCISKIDMRQRQVKDFLQHAPNVIVYALDFRCFNAEQEPVDSTKGGMRVCQVDNLYADNTTSSSASRPLVDPRVPRTIATTRYELYWIWALNYQKHSWIMLLDARDAFFQGNPFLDVPREAHDVERPNGVLHFFGENMDATRIGLSPKNTKWLTSAYGEAVIEALKDKPTICSGSTIGEQVALEQYLRAMVSESDETGTVLMGADQGFHNYLYYSNKLANVRAIRSITVFDQGYGTINNLGAMRTRDLHEWGNGRLLSQQSNESMTVLNWDGTIAPVVHQFDRHKVLSLYIYKTLTSQYRRRWDESKKR